MIHTATLLLGSNVPDRDARLQRALERIGEVACIDRVSERCLSPDHTGLGADYANVTVDCHTTLNRRVLCETLRGFEHALGRTAMSKSSGVMPIDIDLVIWDDGIVSPADYEAAHFSKTR